MSVRSDNPEGDTIKMNKTAFRIGLNLKIEQFPSVFRICNKRRTSMNFEERKQIFELRGESQEFAETSWTISV
ncbi:hypothetical protein V1478_007334 [Vespula squamosa]|uniref:Uncharacterized protein n=1 Tax=Vespula squamosa TaxID=30214 RepID=A0ABD2B321_VESSQ